MKKESILDRMNVRQVTVLDADGNPVKVKLGLGKAYTPGKYLKKKAGRPISPIGTLTDKQKAFVKNIGQGMNKTQAALKAYNTKNNLNASKIASNLMKNKTINELVNDIFKKHHVELEEALRPLVNGLKAKRVIQYKDQAYVSDIDDLSIQIQASDRALKLMGAYPKKTEENVSTNYIQINNIHKDRYSEEEHEIP